MTNRVGVEVAQTSKGMADPRDARLTFSLAWTFVLFNYIYADIGMFASVLADERLLERFQQLGSAYFTPAFMLAAAALMEIPIAMVFLSWIFSEGAVRRANIAAGTLMTIVILFTLFGAGKLPPLSYYTFFQVIEIASTGAIAWFAWKWRPGNIGKEHRP